MSRGFKVIRRDLQGILALTLSTIRMDGGAWQLTIVKKIVKEIGRFLVVDEDDRARRRHRQEQVEQAVTFLGLVNVDDLLRAIVSSISKAAQWVKRTFCKTLVWVLPIRPTLMRTWSLAMYSLARARASFGKVAEKSKYM